MTLPALILCAAAAAAPARSSAPTAKASEAVIDWLRVYPLAAYREYWTLELAVGDLDKDVPKVMKAIEARGGALLVPLQNSVSSEGAQQLSYRLTHAEAQAALKDLKKLGRFAPPLVRPAGEKLPLAEIKSKIEGLSRDKELHAAELAAMPSVAALVDAVLAHLVTAKAVSEKAETEVVLHVTVEKRAPR